METKWKEEFAFNEELYGKRHDIICRGFYRILDSLYDEGILIRKPINARVNKSEEKRRLAHLYI